jgi:hypothetical protein
LESGFQGRHHRRSAVLFRLTTDLLWRLMLRHAPEQKAAPADDEEQRPDHRHGKDRAGPHRARWLRRAAAQGLVRFADLLTHPQRPLPGI